MASSVQPSAERRQPSQADFEAFGNDFLEKATEPPSDEKPTTVDSSQQKSDKENKDEFAFAALENAIAHYRRHSLQSGQLKTQDILGDIQSQLPSIGISQDSQGNSIQIPSSGMDHPGARTAPPESSIPTFDSAMESHENSQNHSLSALPPLISEDGDRHDGLEASSTMKDPRETPPPQSTRSNGSSSKSHKKKKKYPRPGHKKRQSLIPDNSLRDLLRSKHANDDSLTMISTRNRKGSSTTSASRRKKRSPSAPVSPKSNGLKSYQNGLPNGNNEDGPYPLHKKRSSKTLRDNLTDLMDTFRKEVAESEDLLNILEKSALENPIFAKTERVKQWSVHETCYWLITIGMEEYIFTFHDHKIDGDMLLDDSIINERVLIKDMGIPKLTSMKIMREIRAFNLFLDQLEGKETENDDDDEETGANPDSKRNLTELDELKSGIKKNLEAGTAGGISIRLSKRKGKLQREIEKLREENEALRNEIELKKNRDKDLMGIPMDLDEIDRNLHDSEATANSSESKDPMVILKLSLKNKTRAVEILRNALNKLKKQHMALMADQKRRIRDLESSYVKLESHYEEQLKERDAKSRAMAWQLRRQSTSAQAQHNSQAQLLWDENQGLQKELDEERGQKEMMALELKKAQMKNVAERRKRVLLESQVARLTEEVSRHLMPVDMLPNPVTGGIGMVGSAPGNNRRMGTGSRLSMGGRRGMAMARQASMSVTNKMKGLFQGVRESTPDRSNSGDLGMGVATNAGGPDDGTASAVELGQGIDYNGAGSAPSVSQESLPTSSQISRGKRSSITAGKKVKEGAVSLWKKVKSAATQGQGSEATATVANGNGSIVEETELPIGRESRSSRNSRNSKRSTGSSGSSKSSGRQNGVRKKGGGSSSSSSSKKRSTQRTNGSHHHSRKGAGENKSRGTKKKSQGHSTGSSSSKKSSHSTTKRKRVTEKQRQYNEQKKRATTEAN